MTSLCCMYWCMLMKFNACQGNRTRTQITSQTNENTREKTLKIVFRRKKNYRNISSPLKLATVCLIFRSAFSANLLRSHTKALTISKRKEKKLKLKIQNRRAWTRRSWRQRFAPTQHTTGLSRQQPSAHSVWCVAHNIRLPRSCRFGNSKNSNEINK